MEPGMFGFGLTVMGWGRVMCSAKTEHENLSRKRWSFSLHKTQILTLAQPSGKPSRNWTSSDKRASPTLEPRTFNSGGKAQSACCKPHGLDTSCSDRPLIQLYSSLSYGKPLMAQIQIIRGNYRKWRLSESKENLGKL